MSPFHSICDRSENGGSREYKEKRGRSRRDGASFRGLEPSQMARSVKTIEPETRVTLIFTVWPGFPPGT